MKKQRLFCLMLAGLVLLTANLFAQQNASAPQKYALVIGNGNYASIERLVNPVNDATDIAAKLRTLGYQVELQTDTGKLAMDRAIQNYMGRLALNRDNEGFFWFAGHGVQIDGENYLLPVDVDSTDDISVKHTSYSVNYLTASFDSRARNKVNVVVLDACRNNPFRNMPGGNRSLSRGLSVIRDNDLPPDLLIIYSTAAGDVAADGDAGKRNSPFAEAFMQNIDRNEDLTIVVRGITRDTMRLTNNRQQPFTGGRIMSLDYYSLNPAGVQPSPQPSPSPAPSASSGTVHIRSDIAGEILIDNRATGRTIKEEGTESVANVSTGRTTVAVRENDGTVTQVEVTVRQGQTVEAVIERPVPEGLEWKIAEDGKGITITKYSGSAVTVIIPSRIAGLSVTSIGESAFYYCRSLTSINIPSSVTIIGSYAFYYCSSLTSINIPSSVTSIRESAFNGCNSLTSINIPSSVTSIEIYAFSGCSSLTSINIPSSVTTIGGYAFSGCSSLTSITVDSRNTAYANRDGILFDKNMQTIVKYPVGKTGTAYTIPSSVTTIGSDAFSGCSSLTSISIPSLVTTIGSDVFSGCSSLTSITVDSRNTAYANRDGILFDKNMQTIVKYPVGKTGTAYTIPSSVTTIGNGAFRSCSSLTSISIPPSVTTIGFSAFNGCSSLTSISIPSSVTSIGFLAFSNCTRLATLTCLATTPPALGDSDLDVFGSPNGNIPANLSIKVPAASVTAYRQAQYWSHYTSIISAN